MRKIRFLLFALLALLYVTNVNALDKGDRFTKGNITYQVTQMGVSGISPSSYTEVMVVSSDATGTLTIPDIITDPNNQYYCKVTAIGSQSNMSNVTAVNLPHTLKTINANAFTPSKITSITVPKETDNIVDGAFSQMNKLTEINVEAGNPKYSSEDGILYETRSTGKYIKAYPYAKSGTTFTVPTGTYGVAINAFAKHPTLTTINLPASIQDLPTSEEANGFTGASALTAIKVDPSNGFYKDIDGVVLTKDGKTLVTYPYKRDGVLNPTYNGTPAQHPGMVYKIPDGVETLAKGSFALVNEVTAIQLNNVKTIEKGAFYATRNLRNIELGASVETIQDGAISGTPDLTRFDVASNNPNYIADNEGVIYTKNKEELVLFPAGKAGEYTTLPTTKKIRNRAFHTAQKVTKVNFNANLEEIGNDAFQYDSNLKEITFEAPSKLQKIGTWVFYMTGLETLNLPASLKEIGWTAFGSNNKLKTVTIADNSQLKSIGVDAFSNNTALETFTFNGSSVLETVDGGAFRNDNKLTHFNFPATVKTIGGSAFNGTTSMTHVTFDAPSQLKKIANAAFQNASALENIDLPEGLEEIERDAFNKCTSLTEIGIPASVTKIDPTGFQQAEKLEKFTVNKNNTVYSSVDGFLLSKDKTKLVSFPPAKAGTYYTLLPPTIETIGEQAFYAINKLENITIPEKVNRIEKLAFDNLVKLNTIAFLGKQPIPAANVDPSAFNPLNVNVANIDLSVRKGSEAAYRANTVWKKFKQVGVSFFEETNGVGNGETEYFPLSQKAVMIVGTKADVYTYVVQPKVKNHLDNSDPYEVRLWGDYALNDNTTNIEEVVFKNTLDYVGIDAFKKQDGSSTVKRIYFTATVPTKDMSATKWEYINNSGTYTEKEFEPSLKIYVKKSAENAYKTATGWARYADQTSYKIPGEVTIQNLWGTFAREFDADLGIYNRETGEGKIAAFVAQKSADVKVADPVHTFGIYKFKVESIDMHGGVSGDETYVPADNGVLIEARQGSSLPANFYYAIGEKDNTTYNITHNMMTGVTVKKTVVNSTTADPLYAMSKSEGLLKLIKPGTSFNFPVHKAYARPQDTFSGAAKVQPVFDEEDNNNVTGIENIENTTTTDKNVYYNLQGQRVENPQHGVFILNGKKVILK